MYTSDVDGSNSKNFHGHTWANTVPEAGNQSTTSCTQCHPAIDTLSAHTFIDGWTADFEALDATASANVARAAGFMQAAQNPTFFASFDEAQQNLLYAESDEGGGVHNHAYLMALLNDANAKVLSLPILNAVMQGTNLVISWTGAGTLQVADSMSGPWSDLPNATNPYLVPTAIASQHQFYRLRQ